MPGLRYGDSGISYRALIVAVALLAGCKLELEVTLASGEERTPAPRFVVHEPGSPERPHYDTVMLFAGDEAVWHIVAEPFGLNQSQRELQYGETPDKFRVVVPPAELVEGSYALVVTGNASGQLRFRVTGDGRVLADR